MKEEVQILKEKVFQMEIEIPKEHVFPMAVEINVFETTEDLEYAMKSIEDLYSLAYGLKVVWI